MCFIRFTSFRQSNVSAIKLHQTQFIRFPSGNLLSVSLPKPNQGGSVVELQIHNKSKDCFLLFKAQIPLWSNLIDIISS